MFIYKICIMLILLVNKNSQFLLKMTFWGVLFLLARLAMTMQCPIFPTYVVGFTGVHHHALSIGEFWLRNLQAYYWRFPKSEFPGNNAHSSNIVERTDKQRQLCPHVQALWKENVCHQSEIVSQANSRQLCNFQRSLLLWISIAGSPFLINRSSMTSSYICGEV